MKRIKTSHTRMLDLLAGWQLFLAQEAGNGWVKKLSSAGRKQLQQEHDDVFDLYQHAGTKETLTGKEWHEVMNALIEILTYGKRRT